MPIYAVQHSVPLTAGQCDEIAQIITNAHCSHLEVPKLFVCVSFEDISKRTAYIGGKRAQANLIRVLVSPCSWKSGKDGKGSLVQASPPSSRRPVFKLPSKKDMFSQRLERILNGSRIMWKTSNEAAQGDADFVELVKELEVVS